MISKFQMKWLLIGDYIKAAINVKNTSFVVLDCFLFYPLLFRFLRFQDLSFIYRYTVFVIYYDVSYMIWLKLQGYFNFGLRKLAFFIG